MERLTFTVQHGKLRLEEYERHIFRFGVRLVFALSFRVIFSESAPVFGQKFPLESKVGLSAIVQHGYDLGGTSRYAAI